jgi:hypothetical protein
VSESQRERFVGQGLVDEGEGVERAMHSSRVESAHQEPRVLKAGGAVIVHGTPAWVKVSGGGDDPPLPR